MATKLMARLKKSDNICAASAIIAKLFEATPPTTYNILKIIIIYSIYNQLLNQFLIIEHRISYLTSKHIKRRTSTQAMISFRLALRDLILLSSFNEVSPLWQ